MNQKAVKLARRINRIAGIIVKKSKIDPFDPNPKPTKLAGAVKLWWATQNHKARGRATKVWRKAVASAANA